MGKSGVSGLPSEHTEVIDVMSAADAAQHGDRSMKYFTLDNENDITLHSSKKAARETGAGVFSTEEQLNELIGQDTKRLVEVWNSIPSVKPVTKFSSWKTAGATHLDYDPTNRRRQQTRTGSGTRHARDSFRCS
jgi:hypothetical protein